MTGSVLLRVHQGSILLRQLISVVERFVTPVFDLVIRWYIAEVFFRAGALKALDWPGTLDLFNYIYSVPVLSPTMAAILGTTGELVFSTLLALGLMGRLAAVALSIMNVVAAISFPDISDLGLQDHVLWGVALLTTIFHGPGRLSVDAWLARRYGSPTM